MPELVPIVFAVIGVLFIGLSKAGFGGGLGMLTTPLCALAFGPKAAIGILLPLLCAGDAFSMAHYWRQWETRNLWTVLPGVVVGIFIGVQLIGKFSARQLNITIGILAVLFVVFQLVKQRIFKAEGAIRPGYLPGTVFGLGSGITSTFAHGAGPVMSMYLIPQQMPKAVYVGTTVFIFFWINWLKMPFFILSREHLDLPLLAPESLIHRGTLKYSALLFPFVPVGVWLGVWLNRRVSEKRFMQIVYLLTFLTGLQLIFQFDLVGWLR